MKFYLEEAEQVMKDLDAVPEGLTSDEASKRLQKYGKNELAKPKGKSLIRRFLEQLADPMIIILLVAAVVSGITAAYANESFADVFIILFVVIINAVLGVYQESKAEKAIEALQKMTALWVATPQGRQREGRDSFPLIPQSFSWRDLIYGPYELKL